MLHLSLVAALCLCPAALAAGAKPADAGKYPAPAAPAETVALGHGVQRTMTLLATSTPQKRNKVRILFYGQSITEQEWSKFVADDLRRRFPHADLEIENRAIGGFGAQMLVRPAEHDLYPFYPDLLIFHVYGSNVEYEQIIKNTRSRTTAEVLMQTDHANFIPPEVIDQNKDGGAWWDNLMNHHLLPEIAKKYGCGLVDVRSGWLAYLKANNLPPQALLKDGVHLNDHGNYLMAELVKRYLVHRPDLPDDSWKDLVRTAEVGKDVRWTDGRLVLEFDGNRVDVIAAEAADGTAAPAEVRIDGRPPSGFPGAYRITRPQPGPWSPVTVTRVGHEKPLQVEDWTLKVTSVDPDGKRWAFEVAGSETGADGKGRNTERFVSTSGRVTIGPEAWFRNESAPLTAGYEIKWQVLPMFVDRYQAPKVEDKSTEYATTLVQGLENGKHVLEMSAGGQSPPPVRAIRVYRPPVAKE